MHVPPPFAWHEKRASDMIRKLPKEERNFEGKEGQ
jgi:hypothetical protein